MRIIATGGTFDKHYDEIRGELTFKDSHLPGILKQARLTLPIVLEINQLIDSLHMQEANRRHILAACEAAPETQIVVIHGTDTMTQTARVLGVAQLAKTIVLTGAMIPYAIQGSDALFNLGFACAAAQLLPPGVYIAMNGQIFTWDNVHKNTQTGVFEAGA
ncbi:MAG TPA: asparaginase [Chloroflexi bacterium]|nr:asparaginase [Chloroflexota bacterium]